MGLGNRGMTFEMLINLANENCIREVEWRL